MKMRAFLLILIMVGGAYAMFQSFHDYKAKAMTELLGSHPTPFTSLTFTKPAPDGVRSVSWNVSNETEIADLLDFLQDYHVRKLRPEEINTDDRFDQFVISLKDENDNLISVIVTKNLIIQNEQNFYEIVDGPLDVNWLVKFFVDNQI